MTVTRKGKGGENGGLASVVLGIRARYPGQEIPHRMRRWRQALRCRESAKVAKGRENGIRMRRPGPMGGRRCTASSLAQPFGRSSHEMLVRGWGRWGACGDGGIVSRGPRAGDRGTVHPRGARGGGGGRGKLAAAEREGRTAHVGRVLFPRVGRGQPQIRNVRGVWMQMKVRGWKTGKGRDGRWGPVGNAHGTVGVCDGGIARRDRATGQTVRRRGHRRMTMMTQRRHAGVDTWIGQTAATAADGLVGVQRGQEHADSDRGPQSGGGGGPTLGKRLARRPGRRRGRCCWWRFRCLGDGGHSLSVREGQNSVAHRRRKNRTGRTPRNRIGAQWGGTQAAGSIGGRHKRRERERKGVSRRERESDS